jgi:hypothetical protein
MALVVARPTSDDADGDLEFWLSRPVAERTQRSRCSGAESTEVATLRLNPDFREFVESFTEHEVRYLVGGYALAAHGLPARQAISTRGCGSAATTPSAFSLR